LELFSFLFGVIFGSFLNLLIGKLPIEKSKISTKNPYQNFIVGIFCGFITLALYIKFSLCLEFLYALIFFYILIALSFIDFRYKAVPDYLLLLGFILSFFASEFSFVDSLKNAFIISGIFVLLNFLVTFYIQNIKSRILKNESLKNQEALGEGDIPILAAIGAVLGLKGALIAIFLGALFAIIPSIYYNIKKKDIQTPFIPYLVSGFIIEYFFDISKVFN